MGREPVEGLRPIGETLSGVMLDIASRTPAEIVASMAPRYRAEDGMIVSLGTGRKQTPARARIAAEYQMASCLNGDRIFLETDLRCLTDLIRAIRVAEGRDDEPTPPSAANAVDAQEESAA